MKEVQDLYRENSETLLRTSKNLNKLKWVGAALKDCKIQLKSKQGFLLWKVKKRILNFT